MKKFASILLIACISLQTPFGVLASYGAPAGRHMFHTYAKANLATPDKSSREEAQEDIKIASASNTANEQESKGIVEVEIHSVLMDRSEEFTVILTPVGDQRDTFEEEQALSVEPVSEDTLHGVNMIQFSNLQSGKYMLEVMGEGYETYSQDIQVGNDTSKLILMNDYLPGYSFQSGVSHPGVLRLGDVTGDGFIEEDGEEEDLKGLLAAIHGGDDFFASSDTPYSDLNGDGVVDLLDLNYFSVFYKNKADRTASVVKKATVKSEDILVATMSNAEEISIEDIFDGRADTSLRLKPANENDKVDENNPIALAFELSSAVEVGGITIAQPLEREESIVEGEVTLFYDDEDGFEVPIRLVIPKTIAEQERSRMNRSSGARITLDADGTIVVDLGKQIAIKKISITVTKTSGNKLAEISNVEFLNDMKDRIPAPTMNIPTDLTAEVKSRAFSLTWKQQPNVTGYEVKIKASDSQEIIKTTANQLDVTSFKNKKIRNGELYEVSVQSLSGEWRSGYSPSVTVIPKADTRPDPPENVSIKGGFRFLDVSWKDMEDTDSYTLFYRVYGEKEAAFTRIPDIKAHSIIVNGLLDKTQYEIYLIGHNEIGDSGPSEHYRGETVDLDPAITPNYRLINKKEEGREATANIIDITDYGKYPRFAIADGDYSTAWVFDDWDAGVIHPDKNKGKSPIITFDEVYEMNTVVVIPDMEQKAYYSDISVYSWPEDGQIPVKIPGAFVKKTSSNKKPYYEFQSKEPFSPKKIQVNFAAHNYSRRISMAEMKFYHYDSLEADIFGLYKDDMHMELAEGVDLAVVEDLQTRLNTEDPESGELHPKADILQTELDNIKKLLKDGKIKGIIQVHNDVTNAADNHITFKGGLNTWQPLGVTATAGDNIVVYVGSPDKKTGDTTPLNLIATQYHAESSSWSQTVVSQLKAGANEVTIPELTALDVEHGGQLYVAYTGKKGVGNYSVRVSGGSYVPMLDITVASSSDAQLALVTEYIEELEAFVPQMEAQHDEVHEGDYDSKNCILGATDIVMKNMMYSVASPQVLSGLSGSTEEKASQLYASLKAMEEMVDLFYQHKGLSNATGAGGKHRLPSSRLNIRYQRMFAGAFMYAGGAHIGIEWGSVPGLVKAIPIETDDNGRYVSGHYMGWGIAHEIGHEINEGAYAIAEITNNYFSVLAQAKDKNDSVRFSYDEVYQKVTSGVTGRSSNVFTQLGLYWQLHLAYDRGGYNYKIYDSYEEQFDNLFFARVDSYVREPRLAPTPGNVAFILNTDTDNKLMRLACAAAEKDILEFFERWGMVPNNTTRAYAAQFEKETRGIWFANDDARVYEMDAMGESVAEKTRVEAKLSYVQGSNEVTITLDHDAADPDAMLGYEIYRTEYEKDNTIKKPVGFVTAEKTSYTDFVTTVNNKVFTYEVVGYDKYLNRTAVTTLEPVKVSHNGNLSRTAWMAATNMISGEDQQGTTDEFYEIGASNPCEPVNTSIEKAVDGKRDTTYTGISEKAAPEIVINLNKVETVTGFTYTLTGEGTPITQFNAYISMDGSSWTPVKSGAFEVSGGKLVGETQTVYFNGKKNDSWLYTYDAAYVKIVARSQKNTSISITELDILGQTGDNIEFFEEGSIGVLKEDYHAGTSESGGNSVIPKGSVVFMGTYKGNPAYNAVLLFDENGTVVGGTNEKGDILASQVIFAEVPAHGELGETSSGTWLYYIEPVDMPEGFQLPRRVRAELSRVDNANTNKGERVVSNTKYAEVPKTLPEVNIKAQTGSNTEGEQ